MSTKDTADKLLSKKFGVFTHYLAHGMAPKAGKPMSEWNSIVNEFDVENFAKSLNQVGAGWYFLTLMQGSKYMCSPNAAFDEIAGTIPGEACCERDLPKEIINALKPFDIDMCLYYTGDGPYKDIPEGKRFGFIEPRGDGAPRSFVEKWASVLREYAVRYGEDINAWWIDGCYKYFKYNDELLSLYRDACRQGNPNALVAYNDGVYDKMIKDFNISDMTAGEFNHFNVLPEGRYVDGAQSHILAPLGTSFDGEEWSHWCQPGAQHSKEYMLDFVRKANELGCLVTIDVCIDHKGSIDPCQLEILQYISENL